MDARDNLSPMPPVSRAHPPVRDYGRAPVRRAACNAVLFVVALAALAPLHPATAQDADLAALESHLAAGRLVAARGGYLDVALSPTAREQMFSTALLGVARAAATDDPVAAAAIARVAQRPLGETSSRSAASLRERLHYIRAIALRDAGDPEAAALEMRHAVALDATLSPVARLRLAQLLSAAERTEEAVAPYRVAAVDTHLTVELRGIAAIEGAHNLIALGRNDQALNLLDLVASGDGHDAAQRVEAAWGAATIRRAAADGAWVDQALAILETAPGSIEAGQALVALEQDGIAVPPLTSGFVHYRSRRNAEATAAYEAVIANAPTAEDAHVAWFYLGALAERDFLNEEAVVAYQNAIAADPEGRLADDAHWWAGLVLEALGRPEEATPHFEALAASFPSSEFTLDAIVRSALTLAGAGDLEGARARLLQATQTQEGETAASAARWLALLGGSEVADPAQAVPDPGEFDSASLAAIMHRAGGTPTLPASAAGEWSEPEADWQTAEAWLGERFGPRDLTGGALDEARTRIAVALAGVDERDVARGFVSSVVAEYRLNPHDLADLARSASTVGLHDVAMDAAGRILDALEPAERLEAPGAILELAYPLAYGPELRAASVAEGVPPLLLAAIVRQESAFNPTAGSTAGALGLTQVIAPTGEAIAASLGLPWDINDLFRPEQSLRYGAHYLAAQLAAHDNDVFASLAAYNAGPGNAARWLETQVWPGADGFVHIVDFPETRAYLEHVIENYGWYRYIYAGAEAPSIG